MNDILAEHADYCIAFLDDLVISSRTKEEHARHLRTVLGTLKKHNIYLNPKKSTFFQQQLDFLGHRLVNGGLVPVPEKVAAVRRLAIPTTIGEVRSFLGSVGFFRRFITGYAGRAQPLTDLTRGGKTVQANKTPVTLSEEQQAAFEDLKQQLSDAPVLIHPDLTKPFTLMTDASDVAWGAALMQDQDGRGLRPVEYLSHRFAGSEERWTIYDKEAAALIGAIEAWRHYLVGPFDAWVDNAALSHLMTQPKLTDRQARWVEEIQHLPIRLMHRRGVDNPVADMLSRHPVFTLLRRSGRRRERRGERPSGAAVEKTSPRPRWKSAERPNSVEFAVQAPSPPTSSRRRAEALSASRSHGRNDAEGAASSTLPVGEMHAPSRETPAARATGRAQSSSARRSSPLRCLTTAAAAGLPVASGAGAAAGAVGGAAAARAGAATATAAREARAARWRDAPLLLSSWVVTGAGTSARAAGGATRGTAAAAMAQGGQLSAPSPLPSSS